VWQAARLADWLAFEEIDHVVTSPKRRAIETAQAVCDARGLSNEVVDDLDEIDRYCHSYYPTEILQTEGRALWDQVVAGNFTEVGWDTPEVFNARITAAWDDLCRRSPGERVLVSCHGGTVRAILASVAGNQQASFRTDYAAISRVQVTLDEDGTPHAHILSVNETGHFDADRTTAGGPMRGAPEMAWPGRRRSITTPR
jgi:broad specificity phosphatase PhoE